MVGPLDALDKHGYEVVFATATGKRPQPLPPSEDPNFIDPPLGRAVTSEENARKTRELSQSSRLDNPLNLSAWLPEKPYRSSPSYLREMEKYNNRLDEIRSGVEREYHAILIVGGSGPIIDMVNNYRLHELILMFCVFRRRPQVLRGRPCTPVPRTSVSWPSSPRRSGRHRRPGATVFRR